MTVKIAVACTAIACPCSKVSPPQTCSLQLTFEAVLCLCCEETSMWIFLITFFLLLQPLHTLCSITLRNCLEYPNLSLYTNADLVLGEFFPLDLLYQEPDLLWISFILKSK